MFETEDFTKQLREAINAETGRSNLKQYEVRVITFLQELASANEKPLMETEVRKAEGLRRGIPDALASARELTRDAARFALEEKRDVLRLDDIQKAYQAKFCRVWPFCKG